MSSTYKPRQAQWKQANLVTKPPQNSSSHEPSPTNTPIENETVLGEMNSNHNYKTP
jgi:hypothetical protein